MDKEDVVCGDASGWIQPHDFIGYRRVTAILDNQAAQADKKALS